MNQFDALVVVAELALGVAGFSGVVMALGARPSEWLKADKLRLATLLGTSLGAMFLALLAIALAKLGLEIERVWRISSLVFAVHLTILASRIVPGGWEVTRSDGGITAPYTIAVFIPTVVVTVLTIIVMFANAFALMRFDAFGVFFSGLCILLLISGTQFVRLLFVTRRQGPE